MRKQSTRILSLLIAVALALLPLTPAWTATANFPPGATGVMVLPFHISGQYTVTTAGAVKFNMPFPCRLITVQATARVSGGTSPTLTVDLKEAGTTVLSSAISITAGTVSEGTISDADIADEAAITVDLTIGGTSPTWNDIGVLLVCQRR